MERASRSCEPPLSERACRPAAHHPMPHLRRCDPGKTTELKLGLSQNRFAPLLGISSGTLNWDIKSGGGGGREESGEARKPSGRETCECCGAGFGSRFPRGEMAVDKWISSMILIAPARFSATIPRKGNDSSRNDHSRGKAG